MNIPQKPALLLLLAALLGAPSPEAAAAAATTTAAQPQEGLYTIASISFRDLRALKEEDLKGSLPLKEGQEIPIPGPELSGAMQYLWNLGYFSDISIERQDLGNRRIALKFTVAELPVLDAVVFRGNKKIKADELEKTAALPLAKTVSEQELVTAANKIEKLYAGKGYLTAGAEFKLQPSGKTNHVSALFTISEGRKVSIEKITFHGNEAFDQGKLRGVLKETHQNSWWRRIFGSPKLDRDKLQEDKDLLVEFYRNNGYRDARVLRHEVAYTKNNRGLLLDLYLYEGPEYHIRNVTWTGNSKEFATTEILNATFAIKKGDLYDAKRIQERLNYSEDNTDVSSLYLDRGYLSYRARLQEQVVQPDSIDLVINIEEGGQYQLDKIGIKGNTKTKDHVIRRELHTVPGDMFSRKNVVRSVRELNMLNYFNPETLQPDIDPHPENGTVDLTYNVEEKQTDTFNASVGYSDAGFTGGLGVTFNNFSLEDIFKAEAYKPIPHGDGQKLGFQWQFGSDDYRTLSLTFTEPWAFDTPTSVGFSAFTSHRTYDYTDDGEYNPKPVDQYGTTLSVGKRLSWPDDYFSVNWRLKYLHSEGEFLTFIDPNAPLTADEYSVTQTLTRNSIDNPIYPRRGSKNWIAAELAGGILPGTVDFYKFTGSSSWYIPLNRKFVWNLSTQHGYLGRFSGSDFIPYNEYFYMGGSGMSSLPTVALRGYEDRSIGTKFDSSESTSELYGGKIYSKFSTEVRYPLTLSSSASIYALVFAEAGNLWLSNSDVDFSDLKKSAGLGLRLFLPIIGQVGIDYGYGFDKPHVDADKSGWNFLFSFGTGME